MSSETGELESAGFSVATPPEEIIICHNRRRVLKMKTKLATIGATTIAIAGLITGSGPAAADMANAGDRVRQSFCSNSYTGNKIFAQDEFGSKTATYRLGDPGKSPHCGSVSFVARDSTPLLTTLTNEDASWATCEIRINGRLVARSEDSSEFGVLVIC